MDGWNFVSFWGPVYFQMRLLLVSGRVIAVVSSSNKKRSPDTKTAQERPLPKEVSKRPLSMGSDWWPVPKISGLSVPSSIQLTSSCETKSSELSEYRNLMKLTCNSWLNFELFLMGWGLGCLLNDVNRAQKSVTIFTIIICIVMVIIIIMIIIIRITLPKFNIAEPLKSYLPNRKVVFQPPFFRGYVKLRGVL